jgi:hypothetical protein
VITRRAFAVAGLAFAAGPAVAATLGTACADAISAALAAMPAGPVLLNSYIVTPGGGDFDLTQANAAYVYDNALAGLALLAAGRPNQARRLADALAAAQAHDRFFNDGRLRNAYLAGPMTAPAKLPGWWDSRAGHWAEDPYQAGSQTGPIAWAMLLWLALGMRAPAQSAADFINRTLRAPRGYYGGFYGFEPDPLKLTWQSTEQNTDLFAVFSKLGAAEDAAHAGQFVGAMLDQKTGCFGAGLSDTGAVNPLLAADAGIWPYFAGLGDAATAQAAIKSLRRGSGIGFSQSSTSIWLEGTAFASLALRGQDAAAFLGTIAANRAPNGYVYATVAPMLATGLAVGPATAGQPEMPFTYYRRPSLSATAWATLAVQAANPLTTDH